MNGGTVKMYLLLQLGILLLKSSGYHKIIQFK